MNYRYFSLYIAFSVGYSHPIYPRVVIKKKKTIKGVLKHITNYLSHKKKTINMILNLTIGVGYSHSIYPMG